MFPSICRVCLSGHVKMFDIETIGLREIYEAFTNNKLITEDGKPMTICYLCRSQLLKSYRFYEMSQQAEKLLFDLANSWQVKNQKALIINEGMLHNLSCFTIDTISLGDSNYCNEGSPSLKQEIEKDEDIESVREYEEFDSGNIDINSERDLSNFDVENSNAMNDFQANSVYQSEVLDSFKEQKYICDTCNQAFLKKSEIKNHIKNHNNDSIVSKLPKDLNIKQNGGSNDVCESKKSCNKCDRIFTSESDLKKHLKSHQVSYTCTKCNENFSTAKLFKQHFIQIHNEPKPYVCDFCKKSYTEQHNLIRHTKYQHSGVKPCILKSYTCTKCNKNFSTTKLFRQHFIQIHNEPKPYVCDFCKKSFSEQCNLNKHTKNQHSGGKPCILKSYTCTKCNENFSTTKLLKQHFIQIHNEPKPYVCDFCKKSFSEQCNLNKHTKNQHSGVKPCICHICGMVLIRTQTLQNHLLTHSKIRSKICNICSKAFRTSDYLQKHLKRHLDIKPYSCSRCSKSYKVKESLIEHIRTHTGEKPYLCVSCGRRFTTKKILDYHQIHMHSKLGSYNCNTCEKSFYRNAALRMHMRTHTGEKPYMCECPKSFSSKSSLKRHIEYLHSDLKVSCETCDETFSNKLALKRHHKKCMVPIIVMVTRNTTDVSLHASND